jgi:hypothetical protein
MGTTLLAPKTEQPSLLQHPLGNINMSAPEKGLGGQGHRRPNHG